MIRMEKKEEKSQRNCKGFEPDFLLQWGTKKRLRCVRVRGPQLISQRSNGGFNKRISHHLHSNRIARNSEGERNRSAGVKEKRKSQEDRYYSTRAAAGGVGGDENGSGKASSVEGEEKSGGGVERVVWPKLYISLSSKEKEEDFLAMKG
ncbi:hypothetical protein LINPERHAP2_LOCUS2623 [Linum perenne]